MSTRSAHVAQAVIDALSALSNYSVDILLHPDGADNADRVNAEIVLQRAVERAIGPDYQRVYNDLHLCLSHQAGTSCIVCQAEARTRKVSDALLERVALFIKMNSHHCHGPSAMDLFREIVKERP